MRALQLLAQTQVSEAVGWTLIHFLWEGGIIAAALALLIALIRSPRIRYGAGCCALLAMVACFTITLLHFLPEHGGAPGAPGRIALRPWTWRPDLTGSEGRFSGFGAVIPWLAPVWIAGVCVFYLRYAAGWFSLYRLRRRGMCNAPVAWQVCLTRLAGELKIL